MNAPMRTASDLDILRQRMELAFDANEDIGYHELVALVDTLIAERDASVMHDRRPNFTLAPFDQRLAVLVHHQNLASLPGTYPQIDAHFLPVGITLIVEEGIAVQLADRFHLALWHRLASIEGDAIRAIINEKRDKARIITVEESRARWRNHARQLRKALEELFGWESYDSSAGVRGTPAEDGTTMSVVLATEGFERAKACYHNFDEWRDE